MKDRLINSIIVKLQLLAVRKYGDTKETSEIIRSLTAELKAASISEFNAIEAKYTSKVS